MKTIGKFAASALLGVTLLIAGGAAAQEEGPAPDFSIDWYTLDGGGGSSAGGAFALAGTIGQPDASVAESTGGIYSLAGGFWAGGQSDHLWKNGFEE